MKRGLCALLALLLCLGGCYEVRPVAEPSDSGSRVLSGRLVFAGSSSMALVTERLAEAFRARYPAVTTEVGATGSSAAILSLRDGLAQVGNLSRPLHPDEDPAGSLTALPLAYDGIAVVVHPDNPVAALSSRELAAIFTGELANWRELGGPDRPIYVIGREEGAGTRAAFEEALGVENRCLYQAVLSETGDILSKVASDAAAIGYLSFASLSDSVRAVTLDGAAASADAVREGTYLLSRPFLQVYRTGTDDPLVLAYLAFLQTDEARSLIEQSGLIPHAFWEETP